VVGEPVKYARIRTPIGLLTLVASDAGLCRVLWDGEEPPRGVTAGRHDVLDRACEQLAAYFHGELRQFEPPLDLTGTAFQLAAWRALAGIPYGTTVSYAAQARRIAHPTAVRAVGAANARNPVPIVLPCHRVVGSRGELTGFGGGLDVKRTLIEHEARSLAAAG
jgi:methylated-DNA-[protein]-cysteine S-methyltransferase